MYLSKPFLSSMIEMWKLSTSGIGLDKCTVSSYSDAAPWGGLQSFRRALCPPVGQARPCVPPQAGRLITIAGAARATGSLCYRTQAIFRLCRRTCRETLRCFRPPPFASSPVGSAKRSGPKPFHDYTTNDLVFQCTCRFRPWPHACHAGNRQPLASRRATAPCYR